MKAVGFREALDSCMFWFPGLQYLKKLQPFPGRLLHTVVFFPKCVGMYYRENLLKFSFHVTI